MLFCIISILAIADESLCLQEILPTKKHFFYQKDFDKKRTILNHLARKRDFRALRSIMQEAKETIWAERVAKTISENLDAKAAFAFCESLPAESAEWMAAISALGSRPKADVLETFKMLCEKGNPRERAVYYRIFARRRWPALLKHAISDTNSSVFLSWRNIPLGKTLTLGDVARGYLLVIDTSSPELLPVKKEGSSPELVGK